MAKRLTVIISQSSMRHSQAADAEERLLTELMMAAGMDATLVGALDTMQPESTDFLCLSGFAGQTLAVVSSLSFEEVVQQWARLQLGGQVVRRGQAGATGQRRAIYLPLSSDTAATLGELRQLLVGLAVKTVDVSLPRGRAAQANPRSLPLVSLPAQPVAAQPRGPQAAQARPQSPVSQPIELPSELEEEWPDLDRLVDDLDALDL